MDEDRELLRTYRREGSAEAFGALVRRHAEAVFAEAAGQLRDARLAGQVTEAAFILLARRPQGVRGDLAAHLRKLVRIAAAHLRPGGGQGTVPAAPAGLAEQVAAAALEPKEIEPVMIARGIHQSLLARQMRMIALVVLVVAVVLAASMGRRGSKPSAPAQGTTQR